MSKSTRGEILTVRVWQAWVIDYHSHDMCDVQAVSQERHMLLNWFLDAILAQDQNG